MEQPEELELHEDVPEEFNETAADGITVTQLPPSQPVRSNLKT